MDAPSSCLQMSQYHWRALSPFFPFRSGFAMEGTLVARIAKRISWR